MNKNEVKKKCWKCGKPTTENWDGDRYTCYKCYYLMLDQARQDELQAEADAMAAEAEYAAMMEAECIADSEYYGP